MIMRLVILTDWWKWQNYSLKYHLEKSGARLRRSFFSDRIRLI